MASALSWYVSVKFASLLSTPFEEWRAFKLGLIDKSGKKIRDAKTSEERAEFTSWMNIVRNVKRLLKTLPGGDTKFATFAAAISLIKEQVRKDTGNRVDRLTERTIISDILGFVPPNERVMLESSRPRGIKHLEPGTYILSEGLELMLRSEEGRPITFRIENKLYPAETFFGHQVFEVIDSNNQRIFVCADHLSRLPQE